MNRWFNVSRWSLVCVATLLGNVVLSEHLAAQSGIRESLERLDKNQDGMIERDEITPLARPYLERIMRALRMSIDRPNEIDKLQEAARVYSALQNGVKGSDVRPEGESSVKPFGTDPDQPLVPIGVPWIVGQCRFEDSGCFTVLTDTLVDHPQIVQNRGILEHFVAASQFTHSFVITAQPMKREPHQTSHLSDLRMVSSASHARFEGLHRSVILLEPNPHPGQGQ